MYFSSSQVLWNVYLRKCVLWFVHSCLFSLFWILIRVSLSQSEGHMPGSKISQDLKCSPFMSLLNKLPFSMPSLLTSNVDSANFEIELCWQSSPRITVVSCFNSAWREPMLNTHPRQPPRSILPPPHTDLGPPQGPCHRSSTMNLLVLSHLSWQPCPPCRCARTATRMQRPPSTTRATWSSMLPMSTCPYLTT